MDFMSNAEIKDLRERLNKQGESFYLREKELLQEITLRGRRIKQLEERVKSARESRDHFKQQIKELTS